MSDKKTMLRFVRNDSEGGVHIDRSMKVQSRGAYICRNKDCIEKAGKKNLLAKHFRCEVKSGIYSEAVDLIDGQIARDDRHGEEGR